MVLRLFQLLMILSSAVKSAIEVAFLGFHDLIVVPAPKHVHD